MKVSYFAVISVSVLFGFVSSLKAAEGALSHYLPGAAGDIMIAQSPKPGWQAATTFWYQRGDVSAAVLQGRVGASLDLDILLIIPGVTYTFEKSILGGTYTVGAGIPFGYANLDAKVTGTHARKFSGSADSFDLSDLFVTPVQFNWSAGEFSFKVAEVIVVPTGEYNTKNAVNIGRNYWSFDSVGAVSWFHPETGTGVDLAPGIMLNTENEDTDYRTGPEYHLDFSVNQFLNENFLVGIRGYHYQQLSGDSGRGTKLGDFKSDSFGMGPGFAWIPKAANGDLVFLGKWMHDFDADNRFESEYFTLTAALKF